MGERKRTNMARIVDRSSQLAGSLLVGDRQKPTLNGPPFPERRPSASRAGPTLARRFEQNA
jgi:hypothetical protein